MMLGKKGPKIGSWTTRRFRLGTSHGGTPSSWIAPAKENPPERPKHPSKKNRR
jgi:hypothetical protein